jgi:hypothetical protein
MCQTHYRTALRAERNGGVRKKPGPAPDPTKPRSRHNPENPSRTRPPKPPRTHCKNGHELTEDNIYRGDNDKRQCLTCRREASQRYRQQHSTGGNHNSRKTHCAKGHPYDEENTGYFTKANGSVRRVCRACAAANGAVQRIKKYGLTVAEYEQMVEDQGRLCRMCGEDISGGKRAPHIDHDHATGAVRAVLCARCNMLIGQAEDSIPLLLKAVSYLQSFSETPTS